MWRTHVCPTETNSVASELSRGAPAWSVPACHAACVASYSMLGVWCQSVTLKRSLYSLQTPALAGLALITEQIGGRGADAEPGRVCAPSRTHGNNYSVCGSDSSSLGRRSPKVALGRRWSALTASASDRCFERITFLFISPWELHPLPNAGPWVFCF